VSQPDARADAPDGSPSEEAARARSRTRWLLLLIVALAAVLRFYRLGFQSFWIDELLTIQAANIGERLGFLEIFWNIQGPIHALLVHAIGGLTLAEAPLRSVSAVFGVATVPVVYLLGTALADRRAGLAAALLLAVSPFAVWYSQELRNYSMLIFFASVSTLAAWRILEERAGGWVLYVAGTVLGVLSNLAAAFLAIAHNVFAARRLLGSRRLLGRWALAHLVILLLFVPTGLGLLRWVRVDRVGERVTLASTAEDAELLRGATTFTPAALPYAFFAMSYGYSLGPSMRELHVESPARAFARNAPLVVPAGLAMAAACLLGLRRLWRTRRGLELALAVAVVPLAGAVALALANVKPFNPRYASVALPVLVVVAGCGITSLRRRWASLLCVVIVLFCMVSLGNYFFRGDYRREDVRSAAAFIEEAERPGDIVLAPVVGELFQLYFEGDAEVFLIYPGQAASDALVAERIEDRIPGHDRLWFVESRLWATDPERRIPSYLTERFSVIEERRFDGVRLSLHDLGRRGRQLDRGDGQEEGAPADSAGE